MSRFAELREKLEAATQGEWQFVNGDAIVTDHSFDPETNRQSANWIAEIDHINQDDYEGVCGSQSAHANGALIVAAVNALPELLKLEDENAALRREVSEAEGKGYRRGLDAALGEADEWANQYDNWLSGTPQSHYAHMRDAANAVVGGIKELVRLHDESTEGEQDA